jgi:uncharacterized membrane protein YphA (DoxX/SURF4 family)
MAALSELGRALTAPVDPRPLAILRMVVGGNAVLCGVESWANLRVIADPQGLRVPFVPGLTPVPAEWLTLFMTAWFGAAALLAVGWFTRAAGIALAGLMTYTLLVDQQTYSNHLYLVILETLFLVVGNAGAIWSLDAASGRREAQAVPAGAVSLWQLQISIVYFFAAAAKLNPGFLSGEVLWIYWPTEGALAFLAPLRTREALMPLAVAAVAVEFFLAFALWLPALRRLAVAVGLALHAGMVAMVWQKDPTGIIVFALASLPPYLLFFRSAPRAKTTVSSCDFA